MLQARRVSTNLTVVKRVMSMFKLREKECKPWLVSKKLATYAAPRRAVTPGMSLMTAVMRFERARSNCRDKVTETRRPYLVTTVARAYELC